jgi:hypothetical protein
MKHLSNWHDFNPHDPQTFPKVNAPIQVRYKSGKVNVGYSRDFFPGSELLSDSPIKGWRYIKAQDLPGVLSDA